MLFPDGLVWSPDRALDLALQPYRIRIACQQSDLERDQNDRALHIMTAAQAGPQIIEVKAHT
jgi:hypothetical protein